MNGIAGMCGTIPQLSGGEFGHIMSQMPTEIKEMIQEYIS
jgi:hypothetical protein